MFKLITGNVFAHAIGILAAPVTTRLFAPEAFGVAALFVSISVVITLVTCLRYELAIMLPETDEEAAGLFVLCILLTIAMTALVSILLFFFGKDLARALNAPMLLKYLWLMPLSVCLGGFFLALNSWNTRRRRFGRLSVAQGLSSIFAQGTKLGLGFSGFVSGGVLICSAVLGNLLSVLFLGGQILRDDRRRLRPGVNWRSVQVGLRRYKRFPLFGSWSALLNAASHSVPTWVLAIYFSPAIVGFYDLGRTVLAAPMVLAGGAIAQVFFQRTAEAFRSRDNLAGLVDDVYKRLIGYGMFPILLLTIAGRELFIIVFGDKWAEAGTYVQITGVWLFLQFISSPMSTLTSVMEKQSQALLFNAILFTVRLLSLVIGGLTGNIMLTLALFTVSSALCYGALCVWLNTMVGLSAGRTLFHLARCCLVGSPFLAAIAIGKWWFGLSHFPLVAVMAAATLGYYLLVFLRDDELRRPAFALLRRHGFIR